MTADRGAGPGLAGPCAPRRGFRAPAGPHGSCQGGPGERRDPGAPCARIGRRGLRRAVRARVRGAWLVGRGDHHVQPRGHRPAQVGVDEACGGRGTGRGTQTARGSGHRTRTVSVRRGRPCPERCSPWIRPPTSRSSSPPGRPCSRWPHSIPGLCRLGGRLARGQGSRGRPRSALPRRRPREPPDRQRPRRGAVRGRARRASTGDGRASAGGSPGRSGRAARRPLPTARLGWTFQVGPIEGRAVPDPAAPPPTAVTPIAPVPRAARPGRRGDRHHRTPADRDVRARRRRGGHRARDRGKDPRPVQAARRPGLRRVLPPRNAGQRRDRVDQRVRRGRRARLARLSATTRRS